MPNDNDDFRKLMGAKKFDVEHALGLYALSFYSVPAEAIYDDDLINKIGDGLKSCHIYLIGFVPKVDLIGARQDEQKLIFDFQILGKTLSVEGPIREGLTLKHDEGLWYLTDGSDNRYGPSEEQLFQALQMQHGLQEFQVVYVGQAYGTDGSRNAIDRLRKHETLQKIALKGAPEGYRLQVLLVEIQPANKMYTMLNPFAEETSQGEKRIGQGLDKLFGTNEHERITLYEASLISYFKPIYNKEFKNSFPSTNLKVLADCYDKDFSSIISEFCFDEPPFLLCSQAIESAPFHIVNTDLHEQADRKVFFAVE
tara:strand:+ start:363 stop:1295 length:933 start_codon:yes stop_codon:yes gene_type:complete